ncbi:MAG: ATP synthase subunit I [Firmicutes bacterium]|nr:ATP synthase subunit I [Bacillota bacterium]
MQIKNLNLIEKTFLFLWPFIIIFSLVTYLISLDFDLVIGFLLGAFTSMLMNSFHYRVMKKAFESHLEQIKTKQILLYFAKMVFYGIVMYFAITNPDWNIILTFVGIISYRVILFPVTFFSLRKQNKEGDKNA